MRYENIKALEQLSLYCHLCGMISIFLGILISIIDLVHGDFSHIHVGLLILAMGYAFVKISSKLTAITLIEQKDNLT